MSWNYWNRTIDVWFDENDDRIAMYSRHLSEFTRYRELIIDYEIEFEMTTVNLIKKLEELNLIDDDHIISFPDEDVVVIGHWEEHNNEVDVS